METGYDILFFWVARMIMMGLADTGDIPFHTVYLHGLIRDEKGEKMSKVRGNVLNPIVLLEKYGTDALRFALSTGTAPGNDIKLAPSKLEAGRNFANKLWNATRFVIRSVEAGDGDMEIKQDALQLEDRWILSRLSRTISSATSLMDEFQFGEAQRQIHDFLWGEYCDWYIEFAKIRLRSVGDSPSPLPVLVNVLEISLRLLHPYMPFITEELWQNLKRSLPPGWQAIESIMMAPYPEADAKVIDPKAEQVMEALIDIIRAIRNTRAEYNVESDRWIEAKIYASKLTTTITPYSETIQTLARARPLTFLRKRQKGAQDENVLVSVLKGGEVVIPMTSMFDLEAERKKLQKEIDQSQAEIARLKARLEDKEFLAKAPTEVIDKERQKFYTLSDKLERLKQQIPKAY
jgi:valyl-tRNA synthetase